MEQTIDIPVFSGKRVRADFLLPGSKSITNRAMILSALSPGDTVLENFSTSDDSKFLAEAFRQLGMDVSLDGKKHRCRIRGGVLPSGEKELKVGNAGTAMRFLLSWLALGNGNFLLDGDERMRERPIGDLIGALNQLGCDVKSEMDNGCPPVRIRAKGMPGGECSISGKNSSQYVSSLLMAAPASEKGVSVRVTGELASEPYVGMTVGMMGEFGVRVRREGNAFFIPKTPYSGPGKYRIEPDASSASYFFAAAAILGGRVRIRGIGKRAIQGDARFPEILEKMGCRARYGKNWTEVVSDGRLKGIDIDMNEIPDLVPTLAVTALFAEGPTRIRNVANLRIKESDRINALSQELKKMGAGVKEWDDGLEIVPNPPYNKALIFTYNDHRIAMAFSVAGLRVSGIGIGNPGCVSKSFPEFYDFLGKLS